MDAGVWFAFDGLSWMSVGIPQSRAVFFALCPFIPSLFWRHRDRKIVHV